MGSTHCEPQTGCRVSITGPDLQCRVVAAVLESALAHIVLRGLLVQFQCGMAHLESSEFL